MSLSQYVLLAALIGPQMESGSGTVGTPNTASPQVTSETTFPNFAAARTAVTQALRDSNRSQPRNAFETTPTVLAVYRQLSRSGQISADERRPLQSSLRARLLDLQDALRRRAIRDRASHAGGGAVAARAQELIDLITTTIEPESWAINGGRGTIVFYAPLNVLVVRQTAEVHHQIGGTFNQLRR